MVLTGYLKLKRGNWYLGGSRLGRNETSALFALMCRQSSTVPDLVEILWPHPDDQPELYCDIIRLTMSRLRRRLSAYGWTITSAGSGIRYNDPRSGYRLERIEGAEMRMAA